MAFVLGSEDFRQIRQDRAERAKQTRDINAYKRARLDEQQPSTAPLVPTGQRRGLTINQVGPSVAEQEAAAQQEALQRQQALELGAFGPVDDSGDRPGTDRGPTPSYAGLAPSRVGKMGAPDVTQIQPGSVRPMQIIQGFGAGLDVQKAIIRARDAVATGKFEGIPATSPAAQFWSWLTDATNSPIHPARDVAIRMGNWVKSEAFANVLRNDPNRITEFNADPIAFYDKYSQQTAAPAAPTVPGVATATAPAPAAPAPPPGVATATAPAPTAAPVLSAADRTTKHDAIKYLESTSGTNIPKWTKKQTSSGVYGATDGTATGHGIPGVYVAKLKGLTPGSPEFNAEKDKAAASLFDHYLGLYPNDPARVAMSYRFGTSAGLPKNWDGSDAGIRARAKRVKSAKPVDPDEAVRYVHTYVQRQLGGAAPVTVASGTPTQVAATATAPGTVKTKIITNVKGNPILADRPVIPKGERGSMADQLAKKKPDKIKEPPFNMPFNLRAQEINTLLAAREGLKRQAFITGADPASAAYIEARAALGMNKAAIENMTETQALNMIQINNDPRMMNEILNARFPGRNIRISPNSDGTFRFEADGKVHGTRIPRKTLVSKMRRSNSTLLHAALKAAKAKAIAARDKAIWKFKQAMTEKQWDHVTKLLVEDKKNKGKYKLDEEGRLWSHDDKGRRVLLSEVPRPSPDREGTTVVPTETPVEKTNSAGLFTNVGTSGVTPALSLHFNRAFGG